MNVDTDYHITSITSRRSNCALWWDPVDRIAPGPAWLGARSRVASVTIARTTSHVLRAHRQIANFGMITQKAAKPELRKDRMSGQLLVLFWKY